MSKSARNLPTLLYVSRPGVSPIGDGGKHRAYQIAYQLTELVGPERLAILNTPDWQQPATQPRSWWQRQRQRPRLKQVQIRLSFEHLYKLLAPTRYTQRYFTSARLVQEYKRQIDTLPKPIIAILTDSRLAPLAQINQARQIPTVWCVHNLQAFDQPQLAPNRWTPHAIAGDFANEWRTLAQGIDRLFTSKVETGVISGLGLSAHYYPYLPVGEIEARLLAIRRQRAATPPTPGLFLLLGSAIHSTTGQSMAWFAQQAWQQGLPPGVRVVGIGRQSTTLLPPGQQAPGLELRGWLDQRELDALFVQAQGILAPQHLGFGALTRLPEMACAGIPVITSPHPTYATNPPPGLLVAQTEWSAWCEQMRMLQQGNVQISLEDYQAWQAAQPRPLATRLPAWL